MSDVPLTANLVEGGQHLLDCVHQLRLLLYRQYTDNKKPPYRILYTISLEFILRPVTSKRTPKLSKKPPYRILYTIPLEFVLRPVTSKRTPKLSKNTEMGVPRFFIGGAQREKIGGARLSVVPEGRILRTEVHGHSLSVVPKGRILRTEVHGDSFSVVPEGRQSVVPDYPVKTLSVVPKGWCPKGDKATPQSD
jgi:hypothetical protein